MEKDTLYQEDRLKITYLYSPEPGKEGEVISVEDHELWIKNYNEDEWNRYILQRGVLRELAHTSKKHPLDLANKLTTINGNIWVGMGRGRITLIDMEKAFIGAYQKEEEGFEKYLSEQQRN